MVSEKDTKVACCKAQCGVFPSTSLCFHFSSTDHGLTRGRVWRRYACDHEPFGRDFALGKGEMSALDRQHVKFLDQADLCIHDAQ